jgi:hypothetical protein
MSADTRHLLARFYRHEIVDVDASKAQGRRVARFATYVELRVKGDKNASFSRPIRDEDKVDFPHEWARFEREGDAGASAGIDVSMLPGVDSSQADELAEMGVRTIEDLSELNDGHAVKIRGGMGLKHRAIAYVRRLEALSDPNELDAAVKLVEENEVLKQRIAELESTKSARRRA